MQRTLNVITGVSLKITISDFLLSQRGTERLQLKQHTSIKLHVTQVLSLSHFLLSLLITIPPLLRTPHLAIISSVFNLEALYVTGAWFIIEQVWCIFLCLELPINPRLSVWKPHPTQSPLNSVLFTVLYFIRPLNFV